jgi:hypothetical protein
MLPRPTTPRAGLVASYGLGWDMSRRWRWCVGRASELTGGDDFGEVGDAGEAINNHIKLIETALAN